MTSQHTLLKVVLPLNRVASMPQARVEDRPKNVVRNRILIGQLASNGDCLYATAIARQIKTDFPGCHLTWAISSLCRQVIEENSLIDEIWEIPVENWQPDNLQNSWYSFEAEALRRYSLGQYSIVFFTQIVFGNPHHYDGTIRPSIFRGYPGRIGKPLNPSLTLRSEEVEGVALFAAKHALSSYDRVILFECASKSGQSPLNPQEASKIAETLVDLKMEKVAVILSSQQSIQPSRPEIIDGSLLSLRQMAELTKYCHLLMGCSSGISCICTSTWARRLPMIQLLDHRWAIYGSLDHDYKYFGLNRDHVVEMYKYSLERILACYKHIVTSGWSSARKKFYRRIRVRHSHYLAFFKKSSYTPDDRYTACVSLEMTTKRYGWNKRLKSHVRHLAREQLANNSWFWPYPEKLRRLKLHFLNQIRSTKPLSNSALTRPSSALRECTCEISLQKSAADYKRLLKAQYPQSWLVYLGQRVLISRITGKDNHEYLQRAVESAGAESSHAIIFALHLFEHGQFQKCYEVLGRLRRAKKVTFCQDLQWLHADVCWICGELAEALNFYRDCLKEAPTNPKLLRIIAHLQKCLAYVPAKNEAASPKVA
jgi:hypothetical protein